MPGDALSAVSGVFCSSCADQGTKVRRKAISEDRCSFEDFVEIEGDAKRRKREAPKLKAWNLALKPRMPKGFSISSLSRSRLFLQRPLVGTTIRIVCLAFNETLF